MNSEELRARIRTASEAALNVHAAYKTGESEGIEYYVVVAEKTHNGKEMLKLRYFAAHIHNPEEDTWMKNGLSARNGPSLLERLAQDLQHAHTGLTGNDGEFITSDLTGSEE